MSFEIIKNKLLELKKEFLTTINQINVLKIIIVFLVSLIIYLLSLFIIKIIVKKVKDLEKIKKHLNKTAFYILFLSIWKQIPGGFANFMVNISLFLLMVKMIRVLDYIIVDILFTRRFRREVLQIFRDIIKAIVWLIIFLFMLKSIFGFSIQDIAITSAVVTAALAFAFQDTLVNIISGISLSAEKTLKIGDFVQLKSGEIGIVIQTSWRTTRVKNRKNQVIVVPNKELANSEIINYTYYNQTGRLFSVGVSYEDSPNFVKEEIINYLKSFNEVINHPPPEVLLKEYKDFTIEYEVKYFINDIGNALKIDDKVKSGLWYLFKRKGITIPYPIKNIYHIQDEKYKKSKINKTSLVFVPGENISSNIPDETIIRIESGELCLSSIKTGFSFHKMNAGDTINISSALKNLIKDTFILTPTKETKIKVVSLAGLSKEEKKNIHDKAEEFIKNIGKEIGQENISDIEEEKKIIERFLDLNFKDELNKDEK